MYDLKQRRNRRVHCMRLVGTFHDWTSRTNTQACRAQKSKSTFGQSFRKTSKATHSGPHPSNATPPVSSARCLKCSSSLKATEVMPVAKPNTTFLVETAT